MFDGKTLDIFIGGGYTDCALLCVYIINVYMRK